MKRNTKKSTEAKAPEPMDPSAREAKVGTPSGNNQRPCYAIKTLVAEVHELFPETPHEVSNYDGRNTGLDVTFDLTPLDNAEVDVFVKMIGLIDSDIRVASVIAENDNALVSFKSNAMTQDSRATFGLADTYVVLIEEDEEFSGSVEVDALGAESW